MILENMLVEAAIETVNTFIDNLEEDDKLHIFLDKFDRDTWNFGSILRYFDIITDDDVDLGKNIPETPYVFEDLREHKATFIIEQGEFKVRVIFSLNVNSDYPQFSDSLQCNLIIKDENDDYIAGPWTVYLTLQDNRQNKCRFTKSIPQKPKFSNFAFKDDLNEDYDALEMQAKLDDFESEGDYESYYDENEAYEELKHVFYNAYLDNEKWLQAIWTDKGKYAHGFLTFKFDTYDALGINNVRGMPLRNGDYIEENDKYPEVIASTYCQKDLEKLLIDALFLARESEFDSLDNVVILFPTKSSTDLKDNHATLTCEGPIKIVSLETGDVIIDDIFEVFDQGNRKNLQRMDPEGYEAGDYDVDIKIAKDVQKVMKLDISTEGKFNESKEQAIKSYKEKSKVKKSYKEDKNKIIDTSKFKNVEGNSREWSTIDAAFTVRTVQQIIKYITYSYYKEDPDFFENLKDSAEGKENYDYWKYLSKAIDAIDDAMIMDHPDVYDINFTKNKFDDIEDWTYNGDTEGRDIIHVMFSLDNGIKVDAIFDNNSDYDPTGEFYYKIKYKSPDEKYTYFIFTGSIDVPDGGYIVRPELEYLDSDKCFHESKEQAIKSYKERNFKRISRTRVSSRRR